MVYTKIFQRCNTHSYRYQIIGLIFVSHINALVSSSRFICIPCIQGVGPGAVVKAACLESRRSGVRFPLWHSGFKVSSPLTRKIFNIGWSLRDRDVA